MDLADLDRLIRRLGTDVQGGDGVWQFEHGGRRVYVMVDERHNRMRAMTPVADASPLAEEDLRKLLAANFDRALDARFALGRGVLWSLFLHPLAELTPREFRACIAQVTTLADNYGSTYASSDLAFGGGD